MQWLASTQSIPVSRLCEPSKTGGGSDQVVPFQCCAIVVLTLVRVDPTPLQFELETHATAKRVGLIPGAGDVLVVHVEPFQCTASGLAVGAKVWPTATQYVAVAQEIPKRLFCVFAGPTEEVLVQLVPFHVSINAFVPTDPAARQRVVDGHDTDMSCATPVVAGIVATVHWVPSHCSISGCGVEKSGE
jgi:hypothetical protein